MPASVDVNGKLIEQYRKTRACLSRAEAARRIGMSAAGLYFIERGRSGRYRTQPETLAKLAELLRVEPEDLAN